MATATSSVAPAAAAPASSTSQGGRPQLKNSATGNSATANRRSTQSPVDGPQRRNSHKGWQANPQQKFNGAGMQQNSNSPTPSQAAAMRSRTPSTAPSGETDTHDRHMHDRTLYALAHLMSRPVTVTVKTGSRYSGTLSGVDTKSNDLGVTLKWAKLVKCPFGDPDEKAKEGEYVGGGSEKIMIFDPKDVVDIYAEKINLGDVELAPMAPQNGVSSGTFKTDTDISGHATVRERELHRWQPDESADASLAIDDLQGKSGWNQFEVNERLFGVKSNYDENIYTTKIDQSHPLFEQRAAAAAKIAADIEGQSTSGVTRHVAEERGLHVPDDSGMDEEDKYSGVQRTALPSGNPNKYTPPARRAPTAQPTVAGAPHDPAIIASQLARPETLPRQQIRQPAQTHAPTNTQVPENTAPVKTKDRPALPPEVSFPVREGLPVVVPGVVKPGSESPQIEKDLNANFKLFVDGEKERVRKKKADMVRRDREQKLNELKKFSESFTLKTEVPQDLVPILTKDKQKQAEIIEKTKQAVAKVGTSGSTTPSGPASFQLAGSTAQTAVKPQSGKVLPPNSFAAKDPERFERETKALLQSFPRFSQPSQSLGQRVRGAQQDRTIPVRNPAPLPEAPRAQFPPTGPAAQSGPLAQSSTGSVPHPGAQKRLNVNARPFEFKPNVPAFTPTTFGGSSAAATPSPTSSANVQATSRAASPSLFFGNKRIKPVGERLNIKDHFNPFERMKNAPKPTTESYRPLYGNSNDYIDKPWDTQPRWPTLDANMEKSYTQLFVKIEIDPSNSHSPQAPHMMPPQAHHQQLPPHMPHMGATSHMPHQPHHGQMPQHLGIPPQYDQEAHMRQISSPSSVMPSPSLHNATVAPYQQSPVPHPSSIAMYPGQQNPMGQYGVPVGPGGPQQFGFYNGYRGASGGTHMMMHPQGPVPYPGAQMAGQFVHHQMYSPQQPQAYLNNGPPPPASQGYPSPSRPAPMMMHQGSSQGTPGGPQMVPYGMQPGQNGPVYGSQGQQQSEFIPPGQNWVPQRSQSTVPFSSAVSSPRIRHQPMSVQSSVPAGTPAGTPMLSPALAAFASPTLAPVPGASSQPLQRSQTSNTVLDVGDGGRGNGRGRGGRVYYGNNSSGGRGGRGQMGHPMHSAGRGARDSFYRDSYSNDGSVGMMRGQGPPPQHHGGPVPPPPQFYQQGPQQGHYAQGGRGAGYPGPPHPVAQHGMPPPPPQQQMTGPPPSQPQQQQQQQQQQPPPPPPPPQQTTETGENSK